MHWQPEWGEPEVAFREADDWLAQHDAEVRERCAKIAERYYSAVNNAPVDRVWDMACKVIARAIRNQEATE